nr:hypothetical protein [Tanacetum cinerariifolium]
KTLCFFNYALMIRQDYDITSSLRRGALHIRDQLNAEAEAVQIILTGIDNYIYSTVNACPNACEMWKAIERANQDNSLRINRSIRYENQRIGNVAGARETVGLTVVQKSRIQCYNCKEFGHVAKEWQKLKRVKDAAYYREKMLLYEHNVIIDSLDMSYDREQIDQNDDDADLVNEHELLASLIEKLKCEINESKNHNKFLETSNKVLIEKLKGEIEDFKNKNKSLESSNNHFKEANNKLSETNNLLYTDFKKSQAELARRNDVEYASKVEIDCAKARGDLISYKMESQKSSNKYTQTIYDLNQTISEMKEKFCAHQETISILSQQKEAQIKLYKTRKDKELDKVIALENKVKVLDIIVYKTSQSVQTINMVNNKYRTSFAKLTPESDEVIRLEKESRSKLSDLIIPFDYGKLNNLYDLFVPEREKSRINAGLDQFHRCLNEKMVADLRYFNSLELEVDSLRSQLETQKTQFLNEIDRLSREYYYADHMKAIFVEIVLFIVDSGCSKHMTGNLKLLINFMEKFLGTVKFGNDQIAPILGYGDLVQGAVMIKRSCGTDLYSITLQDTNYPNLICLMAKATSSQAWLWHRRLSHLNFDTINMLSKNDIVVGLPKLKFIKDHLCSSCELGKAKRKSFYTKITPSSKRRIYLDSFLRSKDETPEVLIDFLRPVQRGLQAQVVPKSSAVSTADAPNQRQQHTTPLNTHTTPTPTCQVPTHAPTVTSPENMNQAEMVEEYAQVENDEFINIFCTPVQDKRETS